jgi:hypothetical protein
MVSCRTKGRPSPDATRISFRQQTLYFQPGASTRLPAYITTTVELSADQDDLGIYSLFTNLDGTYRDDTMVWASVLVYLLEVDYNVCSTLEPVELRNVPVEMQNIFPKLANLAHFWKLVEQATERCLAWFRLRPDWHQHYPLSLVEEKVKKNVRWFENNPLWYKRYPAISFGPDVRVYFDRQVLCFQHAKEIPSHLRTYLNVAASGYEIGSYCLVTNLDGTIDDEASMFVPYPFDAGL